MPIVALVLIGIAAAGSAIFIGYQVKVERRRRRNLKAYAEDRPLEDAGQWD